MMLGRDNWEFLGPGEGLLEETERLWETLDREVRDAVESYTDRMNGAFPGSRFGLKVIGPQVKVVCFPPKDHPAYDPQNPNAGVVVTIGAPKGR